MRKIKLYIAISLNGKIAKKDGSVDWLETIPNPEKSDYGYGTFYGSVDTTIMGYQTYSQIIGWGIPFPYTGKKNYVFTRDGSHSDTEDVEFVSTDHINFLKSLKKKSGKDIWLIGGGMINTMLFNEDLIDELMIYVMPIVLSDGIDLFGNFPKEMILNLVGSKSYPGGVVELKYKIG